MIFFFGVVLLFATISDMVYLNDIRSRLNQSCPDDKGMPLRDGRKPCDCHDQPPAERLKPKLFIDNMQ